MIFEETLQEYDEYVKEAVDELFLKAFLNQKYETDLLLVFQNALKNNIDETTLERLNITPYQIGNGIIEFRYSSFYKFINHYRKMIVKKNEHRNELEKKAITRNDIYDYLIEQELLIYMKFWETDLILRRLYNISRLAQGIEYCWEYEQSFYDDRRKLVRDEIQKNIKIIAPKFYVLIDDIYNRQIRNAIAHSQYYLMYDSINLTNKEENPHYILESISYSDWEILFHKNLLFYNHYIRCTNEYKSKYQEKVMNKKFGLLINLPESDESGNIKTGWLKYDKNNEVWYYES
jgi:hypothetical protein